MSIKSVPCLAKLINFLLKGTKLMATIEEVTQTVTDMTAALNLANTALDGLDSKLDEIKAFILSLQSGAGPVTQEQLDALAEMVTGAKDAATNAHVKAEAALTEADALDE